MNTDEEKSNFVPLVDLTETSKDINNTQKELINTNDISYQNNVETTDGESESKEKFNSDLNINLLDMNNSGIIQIPQKFIVEQNNPYINESDKDFSLDEQILKTIKRDLKLIFHKMQYVLNPFSSPLDKKFHVKNWELWGPLLFITFLSCILSIHSKEKSSIIALVYTIFWLGSFLVYFNANLLDAKIKIFPIICLLGYCLFPLNVAAFILALTNFHDIIKLIIVGIMCTWSLLCIEGYIKSVCEKEQKFLIFYPVILMFIFISWFIFVN